MRRIQKDDLVRVTTGKSRGHTGIVKQVIDQKVVVEGANMIKKHVKPNPQINQKGGIVTKEASIHISNVALLNPVTKKADKVGFKYLVTNNKKQKVRYFKSNNELVVPV
jgi:large subunit ribosomal protein L24